MAELDLRVSKRSATLRGQVEEKLRVAISSGSFVPGQRLIERELCEKLGVSRPSLREALRQLEAEGLITLIPHRGPIVTTVDADEARQLYELRSLIEGFAAERCAQTASRELKLALTDAVEEFARVATSGKADNLIETKSTIYDLLLEGAGNIFVRQTLESLYNRINLLRVTSMAQPGRLEHSIAELREIAAAIQSGDGPRAAAACQLHIANAATAALAGKSQ
ncbi:MAG: GntR family transcriptional regulator [Mesorhizobium sp.]